MNNIKQIPIILVHGWKSHPGIWNRLIEKITLPRDFIWSFQYSHLYEATIKEISMELMHFIRKKRNSLEYNGNVDIVCHSMGGNITRYYLEVIDGKKRKEKVRQLIEIGVPNRGSSMAEIFNDPIYGPKIIKALSGEFVPKQYIPSLDTNVQGIRIRCREMSELCKAGLRDDIHYRNVIGANRTGDPEFFPRLNGKTWVLCPDNTWKKTWLGDGVIPHADSYLPGKEFDIVPEDPNFLKDRAYHYCHIYLPRNPEVTNLVVKYLEDPDLPSSDIWSD